jgi:hypothetical protein
MDCWPADDLRLTAKPARGAATVSRLAVYLLALAGLMFMVIVIGCAPKAPVAEGQYTAPLRAGDSAPIDPADICATRQHDICGLLLLYYLDHHRLPKTLDELASVPGFEQVQSFTCPVSHRPYIYNPAGFIAPNGSGTVVLYDATPAHSGMRWGISIAEAQGNSPLVARVIALPDAYVREHAARTNEPVAPAPALQEPHPAAPPQQRRPANLPD